jgi:hypothetical protein
LTNDPYTAKWWTLRKYLVEGYKEHMTPQEKQEAAEVTFFVLFFLSSTSESVRSDKNTEMRTAVFDVFRSHSATILQSDDSYLISHKSCRNLQMEGGAKVILSGSIFLIAQAA